MLTRRREDKAERDARLLKEFRDTVQSLIRAEPDTHSILSSRLTHSAVAGTSESDVAAVSYRNTSYSDEGTAHTPEGALAEPMIPLKHGSEGHRSEQSADPSYEQTPSYEVVLLQHPIYRRAQFAHSISSLSNTEYGIPWSFLSGWSIARLSTLAVLELPITITDLSRMHNEPVGQQYQARRESLSRCLLGYYTNGAPQKAISEAEREASPAASIC